MSLFHLSQLKSDSKFHAAGLAGNSLWHPRSSFACLAWHHKALRACSEASANHSWLSAWGNDFYWENIQQGWLLSILLSTHLSV